MSGLSDDGGKAGDLRVLRATNLRLLNGGQLSVEAKGADAGNIDIQVHNNLRLVGGKILAAAGKDGGNIAIINPEFSILNNGQISANAIEREWWEH